MKVTPARALEDGILLACSGPDCLLWRHPTGGARTDRGAYVTYGLVGSADIVGVCRGRGVAIEVKAGRDRQRPEQIAFQRAWERAGGLYIIARSIDDARAALALPAPAAPVGPGAAIAAHQPARTHGVAAAISIPETPDGRRTPAHLCEPGHTDSNGEGGESVGGYVL